ncbi:MAG TPA: leucyl aminopeptidase family protein [Planctomycetota bacterium]|nr:leucyl aminopeptidase family protein [Planctomycetota bacterium]
MTEILFARDVRSALRDASTVLLAAPARRLTGPTLQPLLGARLTPTALALAKDTKPGDLGKVVSTLTGLGAPRKLVLGVLPDEVARHNSPSRAESLRRFGLSVAKEPGVRAVLVVLDDPAHALAAYVALAKAMPLYSAKSNAGRRSGPVRVLAIGPSGQALPANASQQETVAMTRMAARLVDTPPADLDTGRFAAEARAALRGVPRVRVTEIAGDRLLRAGLRGVHTVGRAASVPPRVLVARWPGSARRGPHVALVGKGIVYDTGGLHLKARGAMEGMKGDMGGAAAALGAFRVLARERCPLPLSLVLCVAENAIGPGAFKPDDVLTMHSGKTVEINNTDAEGRLLLADGVSYAARVLRAGVVLDAATLTGAQMVATGLLHAAVVSNEDALERILIEAGRATGDLTHPLPFAPEFYKQEFSSPIADMRNSVANRSNAQSSCAAQFVWWHIEDTGVRWAHVDLAGPAMLKDRGTGFGVALLAEAVRRIGRERGHGEDRRP